MERRADLGGDEVHPLGDGLSVESQSAHWRHDALPAELDLVAMAEALEQEAAFLAPVGELRHSEEVLLEMTLAA